ncbi:MAG: histidine kinase, partial [Nitrosopumilaceae archaeon]
ISFCFVIAGDLTYIYYDWYTEEAPYPSIADVFFLLFYPFAAYHLVKNINYFKKDLGAAPKIGVIVLTGVLVASFAFLSIDLIEEEPLDFYLGLTFVLASSGILALALLGAIIFRQSVLGAAWLALAAGIFIYTVSDVWYYYLEMIDSYSGEHLVNTLWVLGLSAVTYGLYKHKKTI